VNGLNLYYEIHGAGEPLVLLHGGLGSTDMFGELLPSLSKIRRVITVDLQGHGRTADIERPLSYEAMADDIAALLKNLGIEQADIMGYSLGGGVALRTAIQHPEAVKKLVLISIGFRRDGWYPEVVTAMSHMGPAAAEQMKPSPLYQRYARIAPRPADWPVLVTKLGQLLSKDFDWSHEVARIRARTLLVYGDADAVRPAHIVQFYELL
jgi:pimeloyl-ACP methyl ester carboxylesterase